MVQTSSRDDRRLVVVGVTPAHGSTWQGVHASVQELGHACLWSRGPTVCARDSAPPAFPAGAWPTMPGTGGVASGLAALMGEAAPLAWPLKAAMRASGAAGAYCRIQLCSSRSAMGMRFPAACVHAASLSLVHDLRALACAGGQRSAVPCTWHGAPAAVASGSHAQLQHCMMRCHCLGMHSHNEHLG